MKNLKKVLSLILVVAMACSFMVFASAKDYETFTDAADISEQYTEAVDVISALDIFVGDDTGALTPQGTFTRAQAAKIVTYMSIGNNAAERLTPSGGIFSDVPANHWASKYIAYAYQAGILSGDGDGKYRPEDAVTGAEVAKLMNTVLGYGKRGEYVGSSWQLNAISDGVQRGLITGNADLTAPAQREEVIQYVFNTIRPDGRNNFYVEYSAIIGAYIRADDASTIAVGAVGKTTIGAYVFGFSRSARINAVDGTPSHFWNRGPVELTGIYPDRPATVVSTNGTPIGGDHNLLAANNIAQIGTTDPRVIINGRISDMTAANLAAVKVGAKVSIYASYKSAALGMTVDDIVIIDKTVAKALANPIMANGAISAIAGIMSPDMFRSYLGDLEIAKDDIVLAYKDGNGDVHLQKATTVAGQLTRFTPVAFVPRLDSITFGGEAYFINTLDGVADEVRLKTAFAASSPNFNIDATIWVDEYNNVVHFTRGNVLLNYVYAFALSDEGFGGGGGTATRAKLVKADGTVVTAFIKSSARQIAIPAVDGGGTITSTAGFNNKWYSYTEADGVYTLTVATALVAGTSGFEGTATAAAAATITGKQTNFYSAAFTPANIYGNNETVFIYLNPVDGTTKVYKGINSLANFAFVAASATNLNKINTIAAAEGSLAARYVLINTTAAVTGADTLAYFSQASTFYGALGEYTYSNDNVVLDGVKQDSPIITRGFPITIFNTGLYRVVLDTDGTYEILAVADANRRVGFGIVNVTGGVLTLADQTTTAGTATVGPVIAANATVYLLVTGTAPAKVDIGMFSGNTSVYYDFTYYVDPTTGEVTQIYAQLVTAALVATRRADALIDAAAAAINATPGTTDVVTQAAAAVIDARVVAALNTAVAANVTNFELGVVTYLRSTFASLAGLTVEATLTSVAPAADAVLSIEIGSAVPGSKTETVTYTVTGVTHT